MEVKLRGLDELREMVAAYARSRSGLGQGETIYTCDALLLAELLLQLIARLDSAVHKWENQQYVLARAQPITVGTTPTLIYENSMSMPITLELYNMSTAQPVFIGGEHVTPGDGIPIFPEGVRKVSIEPGRHIYGICSTGTVDIRVMVTSAAP